MQNPVSDVLAAAAFASVRHAAQRRKGEAQEPYINHLIEVSRLLADATDGQDTPLIIAGLLHDTIEDVGVTGEELTERFGSDVASLVAEVTDDKSLPKEVRKQLQIEHAPHTSARAKMLKIADKTSNLRAIRNSPPPDWSAERKDAYFAWAQQVVAGCRGVSPLLEAAFDAAYAAGWQTT